MRQALCLLCPGSNFFLLALFTLLAGDRTSDIRSLMVSILVMVWAFRIAGFLFLRVLVTGSDTRFDSIRSHFWSFKGFWIGQMLWLIKSTFLLLRVALLCLPNPRPRHP
ncbi:hypothetical protein BKA62DRAFT_167535 [Auriculariales sp. MPI-PUGE-AT-0066]|nr:hypothetical protein BKA62DRAFT_167535 [Auriculariales sp. MPI-PUGE-AT-0066]